jgi:hypothetical protein
MAGKYRERLTFSNVVSVISLLFALGLGTAWAATELEKNDVKSKHIKNSGVKGKDLADNAVTSPKVANGSLLGEDFAAGQLPQGERGPEGERGPPGTPGTPGTPGEDGASAADLWATIRVAPDSGDAGTAPDLFVVRSKGTVSSLSTVGTGNYRIAFAEKPDAETTCAYNATLADVVHHGSSEPGDTNGEIIVHGESVGNISVLTFDSAGVARHVGDPSDGTGEGGFHLTVFCP